MAYLWIAYFMLAGLGGLGLYPFAVRICYKRILAYLGSPNRRMHTRGLLVSCLVVLGCSMQVQFCVVRATSLLQG